MIWQHILAWFGITRPRKTVSFKGDVFDLIDPRYRIIFRDSLSGVSTKRSIRLRLNKAGYSAMVGRRTVYRIPRKDIEADFVEENFHSLDQRIMSAATSVRQALR